MVNCELERAGTSCLRCAEAVASAMASNMSNDDALIIHSPETPVAAKVKKGVFHWPNTR